MKKIVVVMCITLLTGCSESGKFIKPSEAEKRYQVFNLGTSNQIDKVTLQKNLNKNASEFCHRKGRVLNAQKLASVPSHINGDYPRIELVFECLTKK